MYTICVFVCVCVCLEMHLGEHININSLSDAGERAWLHFGAGSLNRMVMRVMSGRPELGWAGFKDVIWVKMRSASATVKGKHISLVVSAAPRCRNFDTTAH